MNDYLIKNGHVMDSVLGINGPVNIAIKNDIITQVGTDIPENTAARVIDARGCYVTPGLIDGHTHVNFGASDIGIRAEIGCFPSGVTTCVDAGSVGAAGYEAFYNTVVTNSQATILTNLNIASIGETAHGCPEELDPQLFEREKILRLCRKYRHNIVGIKVRWGIPMVKNHGIRPLQVAAEIGREAGLPLVIHMIQSPTPVKDVLDLMKPGDIYCHCYHNTGPNIILDKNGRILPEVREARERGILFDDGHGRGAGSFKVIRAALEQGFKPDMITSDLTRTSIYRSPAYTLAHIWSQFLNFGMSFEELVKMNTETMAGILYGKCGGFIKAGAVADIAVLRLVEKPIHFVDYQGEEFTGSKYIKCEMTFKAGEPVFGQVDFN
jgi:predicted amidohydrolase